MLRTGRTDGQRENSIPPYNFVIAGGIITLEIKMRYRLISRECDIERSDLLKPVTIIMSVTVLSRVVTGFVCTVTAESRVVTGMFSVTGCHGFYYISDDQKLINLVSEGR